MYSVEAEDLGRVYKIRSTRKEERKELLALQNVNLHVRQGELFGLLGPSSNLYLPLVRPTGTRARPD